MMATGSNGGTPANGGHGHVHFDAQTAQQYHQLAGNSFAGAEDYTHYPYPDEYLNDRNRQYLAASSADAYAHLNQQHPRNHRLDSDYSPYGDVSGLPDPFHDMSVAAGHQPQPEHPHHLGHQ